MTYDFKLETLIPAGPKQIYEAWMCSDGHSAMTGGTAHVDGSVGGNFDAWDGFIAGKSLMLTPYTFIRQTWRSAKFEGQDPDSIIEVTLTEKGDKTLLVLEHKNVPDGQTSYEESGWSKSYFEPMKKYFGG